MADFESKINEFFQLLRDKPSMILKGNINSLTSYILFFEGFFISIKLFNKIDIERKISHWYQRQVDVKAPNMYWFAQFEMININESEENKIEILLNNIETFFNENSKQIKMFNA